MIKIFVITIVTASLSCGTPSQKSNNVIGEEDPKPTSTSTNNTNTTPVIVEPKLPKGAIVGNFNGDFSTFYAKISGVDTRRETTHISFEKNKYPKISIPKTVGGTLSTLILDGFDRDLLLVTAKLKDPNFQKYYLYVLRNNKWRPVMNGFAIHNSNIKKVDAPIKIDPNNPNNIVRYYSVFDLDKHSDLGYTWKLLQESIPIQHR